jgi:hypothetical protein
MAAIAIQQGDRRFDQLPRGLPRRASGDAHLLQFDPTFGLSFWEFERVFQRVP